MRPPFRPLLILGVAAHLAVVQPVHAGVATAHRLSFQGIARDASNQPVASGDVRVRIYDPESGGTPIYDSGAEFNGAIVGGVFNVLLGGGTPLMLDDTQLYHLELDINGVEVVGDAEGGRQPFWPSGGDLSRSDYDIRIQQLENAVFATCAPNQFNLNGNPTDGCEFTLDNNAIYVDGGDPGADDASGCGRGPVGTAAGCRPCLTIARGLAEATATGRTTVNVANGSYNEGVTLVNGKSLLGGWTGLTWTRDAAHTATVIRGKTISGVHERAIAGSGITSPTTVDGFVIYGPVNTSAAGNSYAVYLSNCGGLTFRNNVIFGGVGGPAGDGSAGTDGLDGVPGIAGANAVQSTNASCSAVLNRSGGSGGVRTCGAFNVSGGNGGGNQCTPVPNSEFSGLDGATANGGGAGGDAGDDAALSGGTCTLPPNPVNGLPGGNGSVGANGSGGVGASNGTGTVSLGHWLGTAGGIATAGGFGRGGGGGGAGGGSDASVAPDRDVLGGAGGGGGSGACGGTAGGSGPAGGGSIGIFVVGGSPPIITNNSITRGTGGVGGRGGPGGRGGLGGIGGAGGSALFFCSGSGGRGGDGGAGGHGGGGGGGAGGISCGIFTSGIGSPTYGATNSFLGGGPAAPGGTGGLSYGSSGTLGASGSTTNVVSQ